MLVLHTKITTVLINIVLSKWLYHLFIFLKRNLSYLNEKPNHRANKQIEWRQIRALTFLKGEIWEWESTKVKCSVHGQMKEVNTMFRCASRALPNLFFTACYSQKYKEAPTGCTAETVTWDMVLFRNTQWKSSVCSKGGSAASGRREEVRGRWGEGLVLSTEGKLNANCRSHT